MSEAIANAIQGLKPELLWWHFAEISRIPRPSAHEEQVAKYVLDTAHRLGLSARQDAFGNVLVKKPASPGREQASSICLQAHLDMVAEKNEDRVHDFLKDPIELVRQGNFLTANGTTLGADNGIGVATNLAVMEDKSLVHGPLELLFTVEEETGLTGAKNVDPELVTSRILLNLDSEEEGAIYVGCAGGNDTVGRWSASYETVSEPVAAVQLTVRGLKGGHSGLDIDKGLGNAIKLMNRAVLKLSGFFDARISSIAGGNMRNAIPRECRAQLLIAPQHIKQLPALVSELEAMFKAELGSVEPDLVLEVAPLPLTEPVQVLEEGVQQRLCRTLSALPHGVLQISRDIPGLVETSTNVAVVSSTDHDITIVTSQRSSVASRLAEVVETVQAVFDLGGATIESSSGYPGWKPNLDSPILQVAKECYRSLYGKEVEVKAIHAGLECGLLGERFPGMDMISFGPTLESVHSPDEKIHIDTVARFWEFLVAILRTAA